VGAVLFGVVTRVTVPPLTWVALTLLLHASRSMTVGAALPGIWIAFYVALARVTPIGPYPLLDYLVLTSETVGAGVKQLERYHRIIGDPVDLHVREQMDTVRIEMAPAAGPFNIEFTSSLMVLHFKHETDGGFAPTRVVFQHAVDDPGAYERALGCPVGPQGSWNGISMSPDAWRLPLRRRDPVLRRLLETQANDILA